MSRLTVIEKNNGMKAFEKITFCLLSLILATGCDFLDREISANYHEKEVFVNYERMFKAGTGMYTFMFYHFGFNRVGSAMLASACDEADHANKNSTIHQFNEGVWTSTSNPEDCWAHFYQGIRSTNLFLRETENYKELLLRDLTIESNRQEYELQTRDIAWMRAEARFLRAFYHFELVKRYGGVPIMTKVIDDEAELAKITRDDFDRCIDFIVGECDEIQPLLKDTWVGYDDNTWVGRASGPAAMALKSRALLYAASKLHNPDNDKEKWYEAAKAAHDVIALGKYSLSSDYKGLFLLGEGAESRSPEVIFAVQGWNDNSYEKANYPIGYDQGGLNCTCPSQNLVDAYEMKATGKNIWEMGSGYDPANPYAGRDPRLAMSILVNNTSFKGRPVECWVGGIDGYGRENATTTGYYIRKYVNENLDLTQNQSSVHAWILFRYAEILLNYAEALNEYLGPESKGEFTMTAKAAVDAVRTRVGVGLPILPPGLTQDEMRARIYNERRVELAFEEHRFFDVRRWKIAEQTENEPIMGMRISKEGDGSFSYKAVMQEDRVFRDYMYLYPIPEAEVHKGAIEQNLGW